MPGRHIVYLALGHLRVDAAKRHTAALTADGKRVLLLIADRPEWTGLEPAPGVTVHRLPAANLPATTRAARRFLLGRGGALRDADSLIVGDPEALPVAWAARRARPDLPVHWEPDDGPARPPAPADLAVVTPWYPSPNNALAGAFVKATIRAVGSDFERISILHTEEWSYRRQSLTGRIIELAAERHIARSGNAVVVAEPEGEVTRVPVPTGFPIEYAARADDHVRAARTALPTGRIEAPLIHAHTGIYGGVVAMRLARPDARIIVTEHATFLEKILAQHAARELYRQVLERVDAVVCVGQGLHDVLVARFPGYADKLRIIPNAIDFDDFAVRPEPPKDLLRWLYVGRMIEHKGVRTLVDGFAQIAGEEPRATLTLVGSGPLEEALRARIHELGLRDRVTLHPAVAPDQVVGLMHQHDLLVHASRLETFGMTVVEAVATGMPVLVARSEGPAETLAGLEDKAGLLIDVSEDPAVIAEGYRDLRARLDALDPEGARAAMLARFGNESVGAQLRALYAGSAVSTSPASSSAPSRVTTPDGTPDEATAPATPRRMLVVSIAPRRPWRTRDFIHDLLARGYEVDLIAAEVAVWRRAGLNPGVKIHTIADAERRRPSRRAEELFVYRIPGKTLALARGAAAKLPALAPEAVVAAAQEKQRRISRDFHYKIYESAYLVVRPLVLWRIVRKRVLPRLDLAHTERVYSDGTEGVTIAARLAKRYPHLTGTTALHRPS